MRRATKGKTTWALVLGLAAVLLAAAVPAPASASALGPAEAKNRVWGSSPEIAAGIGAERPVSETGIRGYGLRYDELAAGYPLVPRGTPRLLNPPIKITRGGLQHVVERHTNSGIARFANKSKFNPGEDIAGLIESGTQQPMVLQANGRFARTFDVGREIGLNRATGQPTSVMTIITEADGTLVTAFPGAP